MVDGMLLVSKPAGMTSHDVVEVVRRKLGVRRVGHTGTLDPMAQGLLILLIGSATKHQHAFQTHEKTYEATLRLGLQTDTGDADGVCVRQAPVPALEHDRIADVLVSFLGPLVQTPPSYSAVKVHGRPAYWWARHRQPVTLAPRIVQVSDVTLLRFDDATITFRVRCSAGAYIRTFAEAIAQRLGTVGHLAALVRLCVGSWTLDEAQPLAELAAMSPEALVHHVRPVQASHTA